MGRGGAAMTSVKFFRQSLFKALFDTSMDVRQIDMMIHMLGSIGSGGKTLHDASKAVGAQLAQKYINSVVDTRKKKD